MGKPPSRDERLMEWLRHRNALYAPLIQPAALVGFVVAFALNEPAWGTICGTLLAVSLTTGRSK